jgi:hypothetical protein
LVKVKRGWIKKGLVSLSAKVALGFVIGLVYEMKEWHNPSFWYILRYMIWYKNMALLLVF